MAHGPLADADPPDPGRITAQRDFGAELTRARRRAGLTVRQVARAARMPPSTAGDYFAGRHLPPASQPGLLPRILAACGITGEAEVAAWMAALARVRRLPGRRRTAQPVPYRGLASFQPADAEWFFGREELTLHLVRLATGTGGPGLPLAVVGASGSGKSSLLRAGLYPRLAASTPAWPAGRPVVLLTPGAEPIAALAGALAPLAGALAGEGSPAGAAIAALLREAPQQAAEQAGWPPGAGPAVIVDQFEETFTACPQEAHRQELVAALCALAASCLVVIGLRADFYGHALRYPGLARALQDRQIVVGPMATAQLRRAITGPAHKAGLEVEDGLVELLLADMRPVGTHGSGAGHEAGALPLLSHALLATWNLCQGNRLTVACYRASGGIRNAIAQTAEAAYAGLSDAGKEMARQLFLRLVHLPEDARETRARVPLADLPASPATDPTAAGDVLERFVELRLVTVDAATAEITHEALLDAWPRLRGWLDADKENRRIRRFITAAAQAWEEAGFEQAALLRGGPLALARDWAASAANRASLAPLARDFVDAGIAGEAARQAAQRRNTRRLRQLAGTLAVLVIVAAVLAGYAFQQRQAAMTARDGADSRTAALEADQVRAEDPNLAAQLALAAYHIAPTRGALGSLLQSSAAPDAARVADSAGVVEAVALSPRRPTLAVAADDGSLRLWDLTDQAHPVPLSQPARGTGPAWYTTAFSPSGRVLAAAGASRQVRLWDISDPRHPVPLGAPLTGPGSTVYSLAFSPDGRVLAAGSADDTVRLWDISDPARPAALGGPLTGPAGYVEAVAFSREGHLLAAGSADDTVRLWDISDPARPAALGKPLTGPARTVDAVTFSPDGKELAAGSRDSSVWLWNVGDPRRPVPARSPLTGAKDWVNAVAFSPDGHLLAAASSDDRVLLWDPATGALRGVLPHQQPVTSLAWQGPGRLVTGGADGYVRVWPVPPPVLLAGGGVNGVAFSPDGRTLAVGGTSVETWNPSSGALTQAAAVPASRQTVINLAFSPRGNVLATGYGDGTIQLWRCGPSLSPLGTPLPGSKGGAVESLAFRRDGRLLATGSDDGRVRLWDVSDPARPRLTATMADSRTYVFTVTFSPDGRTLAAASADKTARLWDVGDPARPRPLARPLTGPTSYAYSVAFSPDGHTLAVGSADKTARLWDVARPARPRRLGPPLTGPGGYLYSVAFSPDGRTLAAGATDGSVWLWRTASPAHPSLITKLAGLPGHIYSVVFSPSGRVLAGGGSAGSVWLWDTRPGDAARRVCALAGQPLTRAEWHTYLPGRSYEPPCASR